MNVTETIDENVDKRVTATFGKDVSNYAMAWHYKADDVRRKISDGVDAAKAGARYAEREAAAEVKNAERTANYLKQGDVGKAIIASSIDRARSNEDNSFKAMQESALIRQAAQQAAAMYGGPGGVAAFEAWYTYRTTGDVDQAWKAGISTGIASQVGAQAAAMPSGTAQEILSKAVVAGTAGGIAVAMQGGSEADVTNAFLHTGGNVIIQSASDALATRVGPENMETAHCISARDLGCFSHSKFVTEAHDKLQRYVVDLNGQLPPLQAIDEYTGTWLGSNPATPKGRQALFVGSISKLPLLDAVPVDGKRFLLSTSFGTAGPLSGTKPFVVLTEYPECATSLRFHVPDGAVGACPFSWNVKHVRTEAEGAQLRLPDESSGTHETPGIEVASNHTH
ncbi:hypothetical protein VI08_06640 [Luteibacter yeojuensis]|uniref:Uncharacterized protein n=1 Tax=Luteibacter yeojuensis TaxID=345309 RepID=A0A0F3KX03_9GAMM|nr:hypothetical protein VI08_06640 [Luteibacter yeojuensis]